jgi:hypothetical protein
MLKRIQATLADVWARPSEKLCRIQSDTRYHVYNHAAANSCITVPSIRTLPPLPQNTEPPELLRRVLHLPHPLTDDEKSMLCTRSAIDLHGVHRETTFESGVNRYEYRDDLAAKALSMMHKSILRKHLQHPAVSGQPKCLARNHLCVIRKESGKLKHYVHPVWGWCYCWECGHQGRIRGNWMRELRL